MKNAHRSVKIVIDSNVFVSAIVFGGTPRKVLELVAEDEVMVIMAEEILTEIRRIITTKFPDFLVDLEKVEKLLELDAKWVRLGARTIHVSRDTDDDKFIEAAITGNAVYIISGDKDLLSLRAYDAIRILNPSNFLETIKNPPLDC